MAGGGLSTSIVAAVLLAAVVLLPVPAPAATDDPGLTAFVPFSPNVRVNSGNPTFQNQVEPTMVVNSQGRIFLGWKEAFTHNGGGQRVGFSYSTDGGATWAPNVLMPLHTYARQSDPWLTVTAGERVFFSRIEYTSTSQPGGIAVTNTTDGVAWGATQLLDDAPNFADKQTHAHDATGNIYVVWNSDSVAANSYVLASSRSDDGGATWTPKVQVPDDANGHLGGFVRVHPNGTVLATWWSWANRNLWFDRSLDRGATWGADVRVNDIPGSADSPLGSDPPILPAMEVAPSGAIYVVWNDYRNARPGGVPNGDYDIMFSRSLDGGASWSPALRINADATTARQWMPDLAVDPFGGIHAAWMDDREGEHHVYYANSTDGGLTWGPNVRVTTVGTPLAFNRPGDYLALESDGEGTIYVAWTDGRNGVDHDIYFAKLERTVAYTVDTVPAGLTVEVDGSPYAAPMTFNWTPGSAHTVSAPSPQSAGPRTRHAFDTWSDGGAATHAITVGDGVGVLTATFHTEHEVAVRTQPTALEAQVDGATVVGAATAWWAEGTTHTLAVTSPQAVDVGTRYAFQRWEDGGTASGRTVVTTAPADYEATFRLEHFLTVSSARGSPTGGGWYAAGDTATFAVEGIVPGTTGTRYVFTGWSGDSAATTPSGSVVMAGPRTVTASWKTEHSLTVESPHGNPAGGGWYAAGETATARVKATATVNGTAYRFASWTGDATGSTATIDVLMDGPKTLTATWEVVPPAFGAGAWNLAVWILAIVVAFLLLILLLWRRRRRREEPPGPP